MALISCPECNSEISDKATACPKCGAPISDSLSNESTVLQEQTSKKLKLQQIYAVGLMILGAILLFATKEKWFSLIGLIGFIWLIVINLQIWWKHK